jgi:hypothetical protein
MFDFCYLLINHFFTHIKYIISLFGFILNLTCLITFWQIIKQNNLKDNLFKYLLIKSACDLYVMFINIVYGTFDNYYKNILQNYYTMCVFRLIFDEYFGFVTQLISIFCDVASSFNQYRSITNKFHYFDKISFRLKFLFMIIYSCIFYVYKFFQRHCTTNEIKRSNTTYFIYKLEHYSYFQVTPLDYGFSITHGMIRDGICCFLIVLFDFLILVYIRKVFKNKVNILKISTSTKLKDERVKNGIFYMVLTTGLFTFISHLLLLIYYFPIQHDKCFRYFTLIFFYFSMSISFFSYYIFNMNFRRIIDDKILSKLMNYFIGK